MRLHSQRLAVHVPVRGVSGAWSFGARGRGGHVTLKALLTWPSSCVAASATSQQGCALECQARACLVPPGSDAGLDYGALKHTILGGFC